MGGFLNSVTSLAQAGGSIMQGFQGSKAAEFNASLARAQGQAYRQAADLEIYRIKRTARQVKSAQQAGYAKAGVTLAGSPLEVMVDSAAQAEIDIAITDYNARVAMAQAESKAKQYKSMSKTLMMEGMLGAGKTLLSSDTFSYKKKPETASSGEIGKGFYSWAGQQKESWRT